MKKIMVALTFIIVFSILVCGILFYKQHEVYAKSTIVVNVDYKNDIVTVEDFGGFLWQFVGCEDWVEGDICAVIMDNNRTEETIFDDFIISTNYCGWVY